MPRIDLGEKNQRGARACRKLGGMEKVRRM